mmetsp:Transcript_30636/g.68709  ORF Transcript_30636/g.68709 Transcript_30636/m.68709 type:complete len:284 (-) Transcript_30636:570-1421(-)
MGGLWLCFRRGGGGGGFRHKLYFARGGAGRCGAPCALAPRPRHGRPLHAPPALEEAPRSGGRQTNPVHARSAGLRGLGARPPGPGPRSGRQGSGRQGSDRQGSGRQGPRRPATWPAQVQLAQGVPVRARDCGRARLVGRPRARAWPPAPGGHGGRRLRPQGHRLRVHKPGLHPVRGRADRLQSTAPKHRSVGGDFDRVPELQPGGLRYARHQNSPICCEAAQEARPEPNGHPLLSPLLGRQTGRVAAASRRAARARVPPASGADRGRHVHGCLDPRGSLHRNT